MSLQKTITAIKIDGDKSSYQDQQQYYRYHMVMPTVPRSGLSYKVLEDETAAFLYIIGFQVL